MIKNIYRKPTANIILNNENECFSPKIISSPSMYYLKFLLNIALNILARKKRQKQNLMKRNTVVKKEFILK